MKKRVSFTKREIEAVTPPAKGRAYLYDGAVNGLGLQVTANGAKSFFVYRRVRNVPKRVILRSP